MTFCSCSVSSEQRKSFIVCFWILKNLFGHWLYKALSATTTNYFEETVAFSVMWKSSVLLTSGSLDFISSCSLQVCGENTGQRISMWRHKSLEKEAITRKTMERKWQMRNQTDLIVFFCSKWDQTQHPLCVFFPFNFKQRLQQTDIIRACCIGFDTK